jgi:hypothetical protein
MIMMPHPSRNQHIKTENFRAGTAMIQMSRNSNSNQQLLP